MPADERRMVIQEFELPSVLAVELGGVCPEFTEPFAKILHPLIVSEALEQHDCAMRLFVAISNESHGVGGPCSLRGVAQYPVGPAPMEFVHRDGQCGPQVLTPIDLGGMMLGWGHDVLLPERGGRAVHVEQHHE